MQYRLHVIFNTGQNICAIKVLPMIRAGYEIGEKFLLVKISLYTVVYQLLMHSIQTDTCLIAHSHLALKVNCGSLLKKYFAHSNVSKTGCSN